jgi:hypothetical protein
VRVADVASAVVAPRPIAMAEAATTNKALPARLRILM